jgi:hypothetical protein
VSHIGTNEISTPSEVKIFSGKLDKEQQHQTGQFQAVYGTVQ